MKEVIKIYVVLGLLLGVTVSCNEQLVPLESIGIVGDMPNDEPGPLEFDVEVDEISPLKVGEPVTFRLRGNVHVVRFFSGDFGNDYEYRDKDRFHDVLLEIGYQHYRYGNNNPHSVNADHTGILLYSNNFNGEDYSYDNVVAADWHEVGSFLLPEAFNGVNDANFRDAVTEDGSTQLDITSLFEEDNPLYLAFYCRVNTGTQRTAYRVRNFGINAVVEEDPSLGGTLHTQAQLDFRWALNPDAAAQANINQGNNADRPVILNEGAELRWVWPTGGDHVPPPTGDAYIGYAVSGPIELPQYNLGKDAPKFFATSWNENVMEHVHTYSKAGEYEVVFIGSNINTPDRQEILKRITIQVTE